MGLAPARRRVELADIVRTHGPAVRQGKRLTRGQHRALRAIATCRTAALGGHTEACEVCGAIRIAYNSCRNRHCPKCPTIAQARWVAARRADLLPIEYFHVVFTVPHALNPLAQGNPRVTYHLLFQAATATLATFGDDPRHLGGELGVIAILHTWGQTLVQHLHLHCVVTGGALARDGARWLPAKPGFLFPVRALARVFRGKYLDGLRRAFDGGALRFAGSVGGLADPIAFGQFLATLRAPDWVVYAKPPFGGPEQVLEYLGRDHAPGRPLQRPPGEPGRGPRALPVAGFRAREPGEDDGPVGRRVPLPLSPPRAPGRLRPDPPLRAPRLEPVERLANRGRRAKLARCRALLAAVPPTAPAAPEPVATLMRRLTGVDIEECPVCHAGRLRVVAIFGPGHLPAPALDTS